MTTRTLKTLAVVVFAAAIAHIGFSIWSSLQSAKVLGPEAIVVTPRGEVWIGVGPQVWRTTAQGQVIEQRPIADAKLPGPPSNLLRHPDGHVVATVRGDTTLYLLDAGTAQVVSRISPQWPADLKDKGGEAINLAFAPDGRFAIATGGGHTVALFAADGAFVARTAPDTYRYTNGLWWVGADLWTTDTNRFVLRRLDGRSLAVLESVALPDDDAARYLGPARQATAGDPPATALIRYRNGMSRGRVVIVRPGVPGEQALQAAGPLEPTDVEWLGDEILVTDGAGFTVRRWKSDGSALSDFGHDSLGRRLEQLGAERTQFERLHGFALRIGIAAFVLALALAIVAQRTEARDTAARAGGVPLDLSRLSVPQRSRAALAALSLRVLWPFPVLVALVTLSQHGVRSRWLAEGLPPGAAPRVAIVLALVALVVLAGFVMLRRLHRQSTQAEFEPVLNAQARRLLLAATTAELPMAAGEHPVETFSLVRFEPGKAGDTGWRLPGIALTAQRWVVCTDQTVRVFGLTNARPWLDMEFALAEVTTVSTQTPPARGHAWSPAWVTTRLNRGGWLDVHLADGRRLVGAVTLPSVHARLQALLEGGSARAPSPSPARAAHAPAAALARPPRRARRGAAALASALVPGLGQWWQGRFALGLVLFVPWVVLLALVTIPALWNQLGQHADVSPVLFAKMLSLQAAYALIASGDAWRHDTAAQT